MDGGLVMEDVGYIIMMDVYWIMNGGSLDVELMISTWWIKEKGCLLDVWMFG